VRTSFPDRPLLLLSFLTLLGLLAAAPPLAGQAAAGRPLVVIDAGHGGPDPGARGPGGTREKDVTLAIARELAALLRATPGLDVRMTRDRDTLIALRDRPLLANRWRGATATGGRPAVFISIHANAHRDATTRGVETYFLSEAKTEEARRVAAMENAAQEYEKEAAPSSVLGFILNDLRQNLYLRESSDWAAIVQSRLAATRLGPDRGVKQAGFVVLDGAFMPAVLVEIGFITNPQEATLLAASGRQKEIARGLERAVRDFLARAPTQDR
jgi:N-acetylmuramoyl-L-alanine amidase